MKQVPLLVRSELTGCVYIVTRYITHDDGTIEAREKFDVTADFEGLMNTDTFIPPKRG